MCSHIKRQDADRPLGAGHTLRLAGDSGEVRDNRMPLSVIALMNSLALERAYLIRPSSSKALRTAG